MPRMCKACVANESVRKEVADLSSTIVTWVRATRPQFLTITAVAVCLGVMAAAADGVSVEWGAALLCLAGALCAHAGANMVNDFHDREGDAGNVERLTPFTGGSRMIQDGVLTPGSTALAGYSLIVAAAAIGIVLWGAGNVALLGVGFVGIVLAVAYSAPPLRLSARGLGEGVVAAAWLLVVVGTDLVVRGAWSLQPVILGAPLACLVGAILWVNEYPDEQADRRVGKRTLVVSLGGRRAAQLHVLLVVVAYGWLMGMIGVDSVPATAVFGLLGLPWSVFAAVRLLRVADSNEGSLKFMPVIRATIIAAHLHGMGMIAGLWLVLPS
jgi:1,4-dihydroxy-2-naphthoate octaprenyltransferase